MSIFKDWWEDNRDYVTRMKVQNAFNPKEWLRLWKWRRQRANRGWSDRDSWNAGDHIAQMTREMLQKLNDNNYVDWPEWFKLNVGEKGKGAYTSLQQVIDDIKNYQDIQWKSWADDLEAKPIKGEIMRCEWFNKKGRKLSDQEINVLIKRYAKKEAVLYKKAQKAMAFFGRHFSSFWD